MCYPWLEFDDRSLEGILDDFAGMDVLFVTDPYNFNIVSGRGPVYLVPHNFHCIDEIKLTSDDHTTVVGVGGCSALDVGRALAYGKRFFSIPTILSTSCISVNICVSRTKERTDSRIKAIPVKTIVPVEYILATPGEKLDHWCMSGVGDLLANISAAVDFGCQNGDMSMESIRKNADAAFTALKWILRDFTKFDRSAVMRLAEFLHHSSLEVIKIGANILSAGSEHKFYETIIRRRDYNNSVQTHGILVAVGTLITLAIYREMTGDSKLLNRVRRAFEKVGLPVSYNDLKQFSIDREDLIDAVKNLEPLPNIIYNRFKNGGYKLIDEVFSRKFAGIQLGNGDVDEDI